VSMVLEDGTPVEMDKYYSVVTNDFMATGGDNYNFENAIDELDTFIPIRDALMEAVEKAGTLSPKRQNWLAEVSQMKTYVVVAGDNLWDIAMKFGSTVQKIAELNNLSNPRLIFPGQELLIPAE